MVSDVCPVTMIHTMIHTMMYAVKCNLNDIFSIWDRHQGFKTVSLLTQSYSIEGGKLARKFHMGSCSEDE